MSRTLIIHDRFQFRGGAERLVLDMAKALEADIVTEFWTNETYPQSMVPHRLFILDEGEPPLMVFRYFRAQWNFWWKTRKIMRNYDTIIFSGNNCLAAALRPLKGKRRICYCHTPVRYVYDLVEYRRSVESERWKRVIYYDVGKWLIRFLYQAGLRRMQLVLTNSKNVQARLLKYCGVKSEVLYPPIHTDTFHWIEQGDYYFSWARLDELKRVEDIVHAFHRMPNKKLIIASGGAREADIRALAEGYPNISMVGWVDDERLRDLIGRCIATIYIPIDEDFGMSPLEGMSAGKPCIGVNDGGLKETIIDGENGVLIPKEYTIQDLVAAVEGMTSERAAGMREACERQAKQFSVGNFVEGLRKIVQKPPNN